MTIFEHLYSDGKTESRHLRKLCQNWPTSHIYFMIVVSVSTSPTSANTTHDTSMLTRSSVYIYILLTRTKPWDGAEPNQGAAPETFTFKDCHRRSATIPDDAHFQDGCPPPRTSAPAFSLSLHFRSRIVNTTMGPAALLLFFSLSLAVDFWPISLSVTLFSVMTVFYQASFFWTQRCC